MVAVVTVHQIYTPPLATHGGYRCSVCPLSLTFFYLLLCRVLCLAIVARSRWARETGKPLLGVCLGFQCMVVEYCRTLLGWENANSTECDEGTPQPVVIFMPEVNKKGTVFFFVLRLWLVGIATARFCPPASLAGGPNSLVYWLVG